MRPARRPGGWVPASYRPLAAIPSYRRLALGDLVSSIGDGMSLVAVGWQALQLATPGGRGAAVAWAVAAYTLPGVAGGFVLARPLRAVRARTLIALDAWTRAATLGAAAALGITGRLTLAGFVVLLSASSVLHAWGIAGRRSLVPELVAPAHHLAANALLVTQQHVAVVLGPALAGVVSGVAGPAAAIGLDALTFAVLGVALLGVRVDAPAPSAPRATARALTLLKAYRRVAALLVVTCIFYLLYGPVEVALPIFVAGDLDGGAATLGLVWAGFGVGATAGAAAAPVLRRLPAWWVVTAIVLGWGAMMVVLGLVHSSWHAGATMLVAGAIFGPYAAITTTELQRAARPGDLTALNALWASAVVAATPVGTALGGPLVEALGAAGTLLLSGYATVSLAIAIMLWLRASPARRDAA